MVSFLREKFKWIWRLSGKFVTQAKLTLKMYLQQIAIISFAISYFYIEEEQRKKSPHLDHLLFSCCHSHAELQLKFFNIKHKSFSRRVNWKFCLEYAKSAYRQCTTYLQKWKQTNGPCLVLWFWSYIVGVSRFKQWDFILKSWPDSWVCRWSSVVVLGVLCHFFDVATDCQILDHVLRLQSSLLSCIIYDNKCERIIKRSH